MKRKYVAITLGLVLGVAGISGCGSTNAGDTSVVDMKEQDEDVIYGEVSELDDNTIVIQVGTRNEMQEPETDKETTSEPEKEENPDNESGDSAPEQPEDGEMPSMLELTGEEKEITVTASTVFKRESLGGGQPGGAPGGDGQAPEKPEGDNPDGEAPEKPESEEIAFSDIQVGDTISITLDDEGNAAEITVMSMGGGEMGNMAQGVDSYQALTEYTSDVEVEDDSYTSTGTDENVIHVLDGAQAILKNISVSRNSSDSEGGDNSSFYGVGAAILTTDGTSIISDSTIDTDAAGGAGIFAYGDGVVYTSDTAVTTQQDTSGGIHAAGGGTLYAWDMNVETNGESSAAIRSDRGGGKMVVDGGTYTSNGTGSPAVYSTADIAINNAELTANGSEAICIEGLNSIYMYDSNLTGNMSDDSRNDCTWNVILYQSMSGDSEVGNSTFQMQGGTLTAKRGGMFYTTNTESTITLSDVDITYAEDNDFFLKCTGNENERGWGQSGKNGADCLFTAIDQEMEGNVIWDSISNLDFYMTSGSTLKGAFVNDETCAGDGGNGYCNLYIEEGSSWTVTGDSTVSKLSCAGTIIDQDGKTVSIIGTDGSIYVDGDSQYTITTDTYEETADTSGAAQATEWSAFQTEKPEQLGD